MIPLSGFRIRGGGSPLFFPHIIPFFSGTAPLKSIISVWGPIERVGKGAKAFSSNGHLKQISEDAFPKARLFYLKSACSCCVLLVPSCSQYCTKNEDFSSQLQKLIALSITLLSRQKLKSFHLTTSSRFKSQQPLIFRLCSLQPLCIIFLNASDDNRTMPPFFW